MMDSKIRQVRIDKKFASGPLSKAKEDYETSQSRLAREYSEEDVSIDLSGNDAGEILIDSSELFEHVEMAFRQARSLAENQPIDSGALLRGSIIVGLAGKSTAFQKLSQILPIDTKELNTDIPTGLGANFKFQESLARSLDRALMHVQNRKEKHDRKMWGRELIAMALLSRSDPSLAKISDEAGTTVADLQDQWYEFVTSQGSPSKPEEWEIWWRDAGVPLPGERRVHAGYMAETTVGQDQLGIKKEVRAFARLIADPNTRPPLSIGLLGDWGSGKSFFMETMKTEVKSLMGSSGFCSNIAQISFNAWHVSDANLWASIVDHIFTGIWKQVNPNIENLEETRKKIRDKIKEARGAIFEAERQLEVTRQAMQEAELCHQKLATRLAIEKFVSLKRQEALMAAAKAIGWKAPLDIIVDLENTLKRMLKTTHRAQTVWQVAIRGRTLRSSIPWLTLVVIAAGLVAYLGSKLPAPEIKQAVQFLAAIGGVVGALVSAVAAPLSKASSLMSKFTDELETTVTEYRDETAEDSDIQQARQEYTAVEERLSAARGRLAELEEQRISLDPSRRLIAFLEDRARTGDYRSRQGIVSLIRRDFVKLAERMNDWVNNRETPPEGIEPIDRIVLYIDDLDRCSHEIVVQTLEAIHLLLALDLFVVVVAVDSRWLLRSLALRYRTLLSGQEQGDSSFRISTPQNYLEKIFQITYAVAPMTPTGYSQYVDYLTSAAATDPSIEEPDSNQVSIAPKREEEEGVLSPNDGEKEYEGPVSNDHQPGGQDDKQQTDDGLKEISEQTDVIEEEEIPTARALKFNAHEKKFLKDLHPLVTTPRIAKRIVNVYRLIKAGIRFSELYSYESEQGRHRPILLLLAILYGQAAIAEEIFRKLTERTMPAEDKNGFFYQAVHKLSHETNHRNQPRPEQNKEREEPEINSNQVGIEQQPKAETNRRSKSQENDERRDRFARLATIIKQVASDVSLEECEKEASTIARYSLVTGQVWHTWRRAQEPESKPISA